MFPTPHGVRQVGVGADDTDQHHRDVVDVTGQVVDDPDGVVVSVVHVVEDEYGSGGPRDVGENLQDAFAHHDDGVDAAGIDAQVVGSEQEPAYRVDERVACGTSAYMRKQSLRQRAQRP
jgi:hypothetical protein